MLLRVSSSGGRWEGLCHKESGEFFATSLRPASSTVQKFKLLHVHVLLYVLLQEVKEELRSKTPDIDLDSTGECVDLSTSGETAAMLLKFKPVST